MNKTKADDMLISMITPKVKEIEEKFGNNQPLTQEDINTLLLKSQYNHINHLDLKLNEVMADVSSLKNDFKFLEQKFEAFEHKIEGTIQKALNKNMMLLVGAVGLFVTLSKVIDAFAK